jgi:hypothetical protein
MKHCFICLALSLLCLTLKVHAQHAFTLRYLGLTVHPFGDNQANLQPYKLDKRAYLVANFGGVSGYEKYVWEDLLSIKIVQGLFSDCSGGWAAVSHLGFRGILIDKPKHRLLFGMGPTLFYREDWNRFPGYEDTKVFRRLNNKWIGAMQYKLFLYGCEFEYDYRITDKLDLNLGFTPGAPLALIFSAGIKYWPSRDFKKTDKFIIPKG